MFRHGCSAKACWCSRRFTTYSLCSRAHFRNVRETQRTKVIVPDSAHGTNPARDAAMAGYDIIEIPSLENGRIDLDALKAVVDDTVALMMITNPNTLGLFETDVPREATKIVHAAGRCLRWC